VPIIIGGLEASLRRFAHYDYWSDKVRRSILVDSRADILTYGMGENIIRRIAELLDRGVPIKKIRDVRGCVYLASPEDKIHFELAATFDYDELKTDKKKYAEAFAVQYKNQDAINGKAIAERYDGKLLVQTPPMPPLEREELDRVYALPFMRTYHPSYEAMGGVPAIEEVRFSVTHNRGCFGACNFCALAFHQGRTVRSRSAESVLAEAKEITEMPDFKGYIHDVGGPTANFRRPSCKGQLKRGLCADKKCLAPTRCPAVEVDHSDYLDLLRKIRSLPKIKKVFIRSGIRFDYLIADKNEEFFEELVKHRVSGQLKVAPEHCSDGVLRRMGKPPIEVYNRFKRRFYELTERVGKKQYLVPYLMSSHPGSTLEDAIELSLFLKKEGLHPEQVQDFYPTPGTVSTCMFYTGLDPYTMEKVYVPRTPREKAQQRALLQYFRPENRALVLDALKRAGRTDLIGYGKYCLATPEQKPREMKGSETRAKAASGGRDTRTKVREDRRGRSMGGRDTRSPRASTGKGRK